jgi:hypothetical protein
MAIPMSADQFLAACKELGIKIKETPGWKTRNRAGSGLPWGPVNGVMLHHTVTGDTQATVDLVTKGTGDLPGPLYHAVVAKDGTAYLIGWGRVNHAGKGDSDVLAAVIAEKTPLPVDDEADTDGNRHFYGLSFINWGDGKDPYTDAQLDTMASLAYVICDHHQWTERSIIAHADWQPGKPDPTPHPAIRNRVMGTVATWRKTGHPTKPDPKPNPKPEPPAPTPDSVVKQLAALTARVADLEKWRNGR